MRRRDFLLTTAIAGAALTIDGAFAASPAMAADTASGFASLSAFVTGRKTLDATLADRAYGQQKDLDPEFDKKMSDLQSAIDKSGAKSIDEFLASNPAKDLRDTMTTITAIWYLGYTGTADPSKEKDDAKLVTYRKALMWEPTGDVTPIPTYSHHNQNYWAEPPKNPPHG